MKEAELGRARADLSAPGTSSTSPESDQVGKARETRDDIPKVFEVKGIFLENKSLHGSKKKNKKGQPGKGVQVVGCYRTRAAWEGPGSDPRPT